ncbi:hypothetical protein PPROV_000637700 [Pycnococcus provasolii]|uniref:Uncharacterized protein n=1 Tax=Pycnococcus provasolii TaxID=41880 RepID=A0A830HLZ3_9CHLO|nr:hypothetical protein PPROV_000637700 [Pycnococcus provasolii]
MACALIGGGFIFAPSSAVILVANIIVLVVAHNSNDMMMRTQEQPSSRRASSSSSSRMLLRVVLPIVASLLLNYKESLFYEAIQPFGGDGVMAHLNRESLEADKTIADWICFERIHIGAGAKGLRWYNEDFRVAGTEHMRAFRDRMLRMHDVKQSGVRQSGDILRLYSEATISVFDNKRYRWEKTMAQIEHAIRTLKDDGLDIEYVKWENISRRYALSSHLTPWKAQLATVSQTSIYVTEPGTGMMMAPFLSDGAVVVNLLSRVSSQIHVVPDDGSSLRVETPDPMEDNLLASFAKDCASAYAGVLISTTHDRRERRRR